MRALQLGLLLVLATGTGGCMNAACIQHAHDPQLDRCADDTVALLCEMLSGEESTADCSRDLPFQCDAYELGTTCEDEGFPVDCGGVWVREGRSCT